jgi:hypothetical protein
MVPAPSFHYVVSVAQNLAQKTNGNIVAYSSNRKSQTKENNFFTSDLLILQKGTGCDDFI